MLRLVFDWIIQYLQNSCLISRDVFVLVVRYARTSHIVCLQARTVYLIAIQLSLSSVISPMFVVLSLSLLSSGPRGHLENDMQPIFRWKFRALRTTAQRSIRYILPMTTTVCNLHEKNGRGPGGVFCRETAQDPSQ